MVGLRILFGNGTELCSEFLIREIRLDFQPYVLVTIVGLWGCVNTTVAVKWLVVKVKCFCIHLRLLHCCKCFMCVNCIKL